MPVIEINDPESVVRVETIISGGSSAFAGPLSFGFWIMQTEGISLATVASTMETALLAFYGTSSTLGVRSVLANGASIIGTKYSRPLMDPAPAPHEVARSLAGGGGANLTAPDLAMVISWKSDTAGPAFRSRSYVGALSSSDIGADGLFTTADVTELNGKATALIAAMEAMGVEFPIIALSRFHNVDGVPVERTTPLAAPILSAFVDVHADTQRRRGAS